MNIGQASIVAGPQPLQRRTTSGRSAPALATAWRRLAMGSNPARALTSKARPGVPVMSRPLAPAPVGRAYGQPSAARARATRCSVARPRSLRLLVVIVDSFGGGEAELVDGGEN